VPITSIERLKMVERLMGHHGPRCVECGGLRLILGHEDSCPLWKIDPVLLKTCMDEASAFLKKNINRQRLFPGKTFGNGPPPNKTNCRPRKMSKPVITTELLYCDICSDEKLFIAGRCSGCVRL